MKEFISKGDDLGPESNRKRKGRARGREKGRKEKREAEKEKGYGIKTNLLVKFCAISVRKLF